MRQEFALKAERSSNGKETMLLTSATRKIEQNPLPIDIQALRKLDNFTIPLFRMFNGLGDLMEHIMYF